MHPPPQLPSARRGLHPITVHAGEVVLRNGPYHLEVVKDEECNGDTLISWAMGATLPPT